MAVLVTGLGYIGSALAQRLLQQGDEVVGVENFFSTPREPVRQLSQYGRFHLVEGSITDEDTLSRAFRLAEPDTVFQLAAQASAQPDAAPLAYTEATNFTGPRLVLEQCAAARVPRVILASSTRVYATPLPPRLSEQSPLRPPDLVHLSHLYAETILAPSSLLHPGWDPSLVALRLGTVHGVGPVMKTDHRFLAVPQIYCLQAAQGERLVVGWRGTLLACIHLEDAVEAFLRSRELPAGVWVANAAAEVRSLASIARLVRKAGRQRGLSVRITALGRAPRYAPRQVSSLLDTTGFRPSRRIEDSLGEVLDYYLKMPAHPPPGAFGPLPPAG